jgi:two-component system NarL family sensor kinase
MIQGVSGQTGARRRLPVSLLMLTLVLFGVAGWCVAARALSPSDGTTISVGDSPFATDGVIIQDVRDPNGPFRIGDRIVSINGEHLADRFGRLPGGATPATGDQVRYELRRGEERVFVDVTLRPYPLLESLARGWPILLVNALLIFTASTIFWIRPREPATNAAFLASAIGIVTTAGSGYFSLEAIDLVAGQQFWRWYAGEFGFALLWGGMLHFALAFPAVTQPERYRRRVLLGYAGPLVLYGIASAGAVLILREAFQQTYVLSSPVLPALFVYPLLVLGVLVHKYVTCTDSAIRRPLRWLAASLGGGAAVWSAIWFIPVLVNGDPLLPDQYQSLAFAGVPLSVTATILRHRALNIEVVISRSLVYGALSAGVIGLYIAVVSGLSLIFPPIDRLWQQAAAVAVIAVLVQPLRVRLQTLINKRLYGDRDDPYRVVSTLASRLEITDTPGAMLPAIVETVSTALRLPYVAIEIQARGHSETAASVGVGSGELHRMPLTYQGERVGYLVIGPRSSRDVLRRRDRIALAEVARTAGAAVYTARLTRDLRRSRDRLVRAREKERRRILHELHDGVGPTLAAVALGIDASQRSVGNGTATGVLLGRLRDELQAAIVEIRRLAHGLRPPVLDRIGLVPAIREYAGALASRSVRLDDPEGPGVTIVLEVPTVLPQLPASVDVAAYRIICEALTNVTRHASARSCAVRLWVDDDLHIEIVDDGIGIGVPALTDGGGVGLSSMRERAAELGGECLVEADREGGTRVFATLPLPKEVG